MWSETVWSRSSYMFSNTMEVSCFSPQAEGATLTQLSYHTSIFVFDTPSCGHAGAYLADDVAECA